LQVFLPLIDLSADYADFTDWKKKKKKKKKRVYP
jgi:hypothetical protein